MSSSSKTTPAAHDSRSGNAYRVAIVGAATLKGKEVAEVLNDRNFPALDVKLLPEDLLQIERVFPQGAAAGQRYSDQMMQLIDAA